MLTLNISILLDEICLTRGLSIINLPVNFEVERIFVYIYKIGVYVNLYILQKKDSISVKIPAIKHLNI